MFYLSLESQRLPTFPGIPSIIGGGGLNFRVRDGNGCFTSPISAVTKILYHIKKNFNTCGAPKIMIFQPQSKQVTRNPEKNPRSFPTLKLLRDVPLLPE